MNAATPLAPITFFMFADSGPACPKGILALGDRDRMRADAGFLFGKKTGHRR